MPKKTLTTPQIEKILRKDIIKKWVKFLVELNSNGIIVDEGNQKTFFTIFQEGYLEGMDSCMNLIGSGSKENG